ncbi:MAG: hypothetical protein HYW45_00520 [Candidatus Daviesbacteria bacterium]|nr:MAG: hypothetical protein HYW45_00520 [Candidatus Daviesbacteria bacterium]
MIKFTLLLAIIWQLILYFRFPGFIWEDAFVMSWFTDKGLKFYQDFDGGRYFPFLKLVMIPIDKMTNWDVNTTIVLGLILAFCAILLIYHISKRLSEAQFISLTFFTIWFGFILRQNTFEVNLFLGLLMLIDIFLFYKWLENPKKELVFLIGFVSSVAVFSEQIALVFTTILFFLIIIYSKISKFNSQSAEVYKIILPFVFGFILIPIPMILWFYSQGLIDQFIQQNILYYINGSGYPFNKSFPQNYMLMLFFINIPFILLTIRLLNKQKMALIKKGDKNTWQEIVIWFFLLTSIIITLIAVLHPRRFLLILPVLSILSEIEYQRIKVAGKFYKLIAILLVLAFSIYSITTIIPWYKDALTKGRQFAIYNLHHPGDNGYEAIDWIKTNTNPQTRIFSFETMIVYFEADRLPIINRTYILPWAFEPFDEMKVLLEKEKADYWLVDENHFTRFKSLGYGYQSNYIRSYLDKYYTRVQSFGWASIYALKTNNI